MDDVEALWPAAWVRAAMGTAVLACLESEELHGYAIAERLAERGLGRPKGGSLYPLLGALGDSGAVEATWVQGEKGPGRRSYAITPAGRERLAEERTSWTQLTSALDNTVPHEEASA